MGHWFVPLWCSHIFFENITGSRNRKKTAEYLSRYAHQWHKYFWSENSGDEKMDLKQDSTNTASASEYFWQNLEVYPEPKLKTTAVH